MSRAFVKEPDGDQVADDLPDLPLSRHPNYVTPAGLAALRDRIEALEAERRALGGEASLPREALRLRQVERELRYLRSRVESAILIDPTRQSHDEVAFGARVEVEDEAGQRRCFMIVGEDEAEAEAGKVSWLSPLARALIGAGAGDLVVWQRPLGDLELEIVAISYDRS